MSTAVPASDLDSTITEVQTMTMQLSEIHADAIDLAALAGMLAHELIHGRRIHPDDEGKADVGAVAHLLAQRLDVHRDALDALGTASGG
jgi:hypothetical protein